MRVSTGGSGSSCPAPPSRSRHGGVSAGLASPSTWGGDPRFGVVPGMQPLQVQGGQAGRAEAAGSPHLPPPASWC